MLVGFDGALDSTAGVMSPGEAPRTFVLSDTGWPDAYVAAESGTPNRAAIWIGNNTDFDIRLYLFKMDPNLTNQVLIGESEIRSDAQLTPNDWNIFTVTATEDVVQGDQYTLGVAYGAASETLEVGLSDVTGDFAGIFFSQGPDDAPLNEFSVDDRNMAIGNTHRYLLYFFEDGASGPSGPDITGQPTSQTVTAPASATFTVAATGEGTLSYQWQVNDGGGWENISGATSTSYNTGSTTTALDGYQYRVNVTDDNDTVTSNAVTLTVEAAVSPVISSGEVINRTTDGFQLRFTTDTANGTAYYVVYAVGATDPDADQIVAGNNGDNVAATRSGSQAVSTTGAQTFPAITGLSVGTYRYAIVHFGNAE